MRALLNQHYEHRCDEQLVGQRVEQFSNGGNRIRAPSQDAVQQISKRGDAIDHESEILRKTGGWRYQQRHYNRYGGHPEIGQDVGQSREAFP